MKRRENNTIVHWFCAAVRRMEKHGGRPRPQGHGDCEGTFVSIAPAVAGHQPV